MKRSRKRKRKGREQKSALASYGEGNVNPNGCLKRLGCRKGKRLLSLGTKGEQEKRFECWSKSLGKGKEAAAEGGTHNTDHGKRQAPLPEDKKLGDGPREGEGVGGPASPKSGENETTMRRVEKTPLAGPKGKGVLRLIRETNHACPGASEKRKWRAERKGVQCVLKKKNGGGGVPRGGEGHSDAPIRSCLESG